MDPKLFDKLYCNPIACENFTKIPVIISEKDMYLNFPIKDKNIIFIVGFAGAGKTTLSNKLKSKYGIEYVCHLDDFVYLDYFDNISKSKIINFFKNKNEIYYNFIKKYPDYVEHILKVEKLLETKPDIQEIRPYMIETTKYIYKLIDFIKNKKYSCIIEGIDLYNVFYYNPEYLTYPIIVKGTSKLESIFRAIKRDNYKVSFDRIIDFFNWSSDSEIEINHLLLRYSELYDLQKK